jgi:hypothetical protein
MQTASHVGRGQCVSSCQGTLATTRTPSPNAAATVPLPRTVPLVSYLADACVKIEARLGGGGTADEQRPRRAAQRVCLAAYAPHALRTASGGAAPLPEAALPSRWTTSSVLPGLSFLLNLSFLVAGRPHLPARQGVAGHRQPGTARAVRTRHQLPAAAGPHDASDAPCGGGHPFCRRQTDCSGTFFPLGDWPFVSVAGNGKPATPPRQEAQLRVVPDAQPGGMASTLLVTRCRARKRCRQTLSSRNLMGCARSKLGSHQNLIWRPWWVHSISRWWVAALDRPAPHSAQRLRKPTL